MNFQYKLVLSELEFKGKHYRFDFYRTRANMISWKGRVDNLPELDIHFQKFALLTVNDYFPANMYPGFILNITCIRDPFSKIVKHLYPCFILNVLVLMVYQLDPQKIADRVSNIGFLLFSFVSILKNMKSAMPEIPLMTIADKYMYL